MVSLFILNENDAVVADIETLEPPAITPQVPDRTTAK
jgi:hypothetical protein